jgi:hypothetical protein
VVRSPDQEYAGIAVKRGRDPDLLTTSQASARLRGLVAAGTLRRWALEGRIPGALVIVPTGAVVLPRGSVDQLVEAVPGQPRENGPPKRRQPLNRTAAAKLRQPAPSAHANGVATAPKA